MFSLAFASTVQAGTVISEQRQSELENLLIQDCGSCHGLRMKGGLGPALLPKQLEAQSVEFITNTILNGRPGSAMPAWSGLLSPLEASWMAKRLKSGQISSELTSGEVAGDAQ